MAKKFDRSKFKAAQIEANKAVVSETEAITRIENKRGDYHSIDDDRPNYFRILPPHNPDEPSCQPKAIYWLECLIDEMQDGEPTGKKVRKQRPIFDSRIHGGTEKDIVDEYIKATRKMQSDMIDDKEEYRKKMNAITGYRDSKKQWHPGILLSTSYVYYATKNGISPENIGRLELYKTDKEKLDELNYDDNADEPILVDLLSDPDEGVEVIITMAREDGKKKKVIKKREANISSLKGAEKIGAAIEKFRESQQVSDEVLEKFAEMDSLKSQFKGAYKESDFKRALEALQYFDKKHGYDTFESDEFLDTVAEIAEYYEDESDVPANDEDQDSNESAANSNINWEDHDSVSEGLSEMSRDELKDIIVQEQIPLRVIKTTTEEMMIDAILKAFFPDEESSDGQPQAEELGGLVPGRRSSASDVLSQLSRRRQNKKTDDLPF